MDKRLPGVIRGVSPCAECSERHTACHDNCPKYKEWKAEMQKVKDKKKEYDRLNRRKGWQRTITWQDNKP
jgi:hypothetical protein